MKQLRRVIHQLKSGFPGVTGSSASRVETVSTGIKEKELDPGSQETLKQQSCQVFRKVRKISPWSASRKRIIIIDLRQEFHWFIHNRNEWIPFNLFEPDFPYNRAKDKKTIVAEEIKLREAINCRPYVDILHITQKGAAGRAQKSEKIRIHKANSPFCLTEAQLIEKYFSKSCLYYRVPIQDHCTPDAKAFDMLKEIIEKHKGDWLHLHCKGGVGRTSLILLAIDILRNKKQFTFKAYVQRQIDRGGANLWKRKYRKRLERVRKLTGF